MTIPPFIMTAGLTWGTWFRRSPDVYRMSSSRTLLSIIGSGFKSIIGSGFLSVIGSGSLLGVGLPPLSWGRVPAGSRPNSTGEGRSLPILLAISASILYRPAASICVRGVSGTPFLFLASSKASFPKRAATPPDANVPPNPIRPSVPPKPPPKMSPTKPN